MRFLRVWYLRCLIRTSFITVSKVCMGIVPVRTFVYIKQEKCHENNKPYGKYRRRK